MREDERVESMAVVIATGVNLQGRREVLGLILLGHKLLAPQNGQHGSCRISQPVILSRMLAIDSASCRRTCPRAVPRPIVHRQLRSCQLKPAWSRREDKAPFG